MQFADLQRRAAARLPPVAWRYYQGTADPDDGLVEGPAADEAAWLRIATVPRVMRGVRSVDTAVKLGGLVLPTPVIVAATAAHGLAHPDAELATAEGARRAGALMVYSSSASVEVTRFGRSASGPWWAQVYVMSELDRTRDYLRRCTEAGAEAIVLTVDLGPLGDAPFRAGSDQLPTLPANYPGWSFAEMAAAIEPALTPDHIGWVAELTGLPVYVKGVLHPADALLAVEAGAAGVIVSNHGRRQSAGVVPTAVALPPVVEAVAGRVPVIVDGGIRSGADVLRALASGADAAGIGRPVLWGLSAGGPEGVAEVIATLTAELSAALGAVGAGSPADVDPSFVRAPTW
jgi:4-hydroxymandelate oxidase